MAYTDPGGDGVGGWLSVFVVMVGIFSPLRMLLDILSLYSDSSVAYLDSGIWTNLQLLAWGVTLTSVAGWWYVCWRLFARQYWATVRVAIILIWTIGIGGMAVQIVGLSLIGDIPISYLVERLGLWAYQPAAFCILWTAYFLLSKRVANTYPRFPQAEEAGQVFE
ncbi:MAG TPA: DUF2569 family protein [Allosphingosinicella sp.]|nr:DUF2569 family protein [Allosphingosinicella sp.]